MIRLSVTLLAALYAGFVIWGEPAETQVAEASVDAPIVTAAASPDFEQPVILGSDTQGDAIVTRAAVTETVVPDAASIAASAPAPQTSFNEPRLIGEPVVVSLVQPERPAEVTAAATAADEDLLRVTGSRVNMRSGPSTSNAVVGSLGRGDLAEALGTETNGWIEIRDVATGQSGFMAARFLEPS